MKTIIILLAAVLILTMAFEVHCQEAYVVQLQVPDAETVRETWDALQTAKANWEAVQKKIALKYLVVDPKDPDASDHHFVGSSITGFLVPSGSSFVNISNGQCLGATNPPTWVACDGKPLTPEQIKKLEKEKQLEAAEENERHEAFLKEKRVRRGFDSDTEATPEFPPKFQFSHDFRYIVPAVPEAPMHTQGDILWQGGIAPLTSH